MKRAALALAVCAGLSLTGCFSFKRSAPKPGLTYVGSKPVVLQARLVGNVLMVETKWDKFGPYHFIIDTGSSVTLVSPDLAARYSRGEVPPEDEPRVLVRSAVGAKVLLRPVTLKSIQLGSARFEEAPALIYDCTDLTSQFGVPIDGVLGFPLFRKVVLTLDYPHERVILRSKLAEDDLPAEALLFSNPDKTPIIDIRLGGRGLVALIDSGSSEAFEINPAGLDPKFLSGPVDGPVVNTLAGDRPSRVGRIDGVIHVGTLDVANPLAEVTDELSSIGGGFLRHFIVTFDQEHDEAFLQRDSPDEVSIPALRGTGMSFRKTPAYWKVVGVMPGSPAAEAGVGVGDLVSRINGEPVAGWGPRRAERLTEGASSVQFTFIEGTRESVKTLKVVDLVP